MSVKQNRGDGAVGSPRRSSSRSVPVGSKNGAGDLGRKGSDSMSFLDSKQSMRFRGHVDSLILRGRAVARELAAAEPSCVEGSQKELVSSNAIPQKLVSKLKQVVADYPGLSMPAGVSKIPNLMKGIGETNALKETRTTPIGQSSGAVGLEIGPGSNINIPGIRPIVNGDSLGADDNILGQEKM
ncbi:hypothetical protein COLO4_33853 [Corchorus olitorius]|uniref:Uncharacterized protein n=1 Tax=Corchorus olitorius TaxID=93759 RepID=A0A1R3GQI0_9ROSI|nr:hypothetical protein COLO4_33853 [Corchorus olitorius]